MQMRLESQACLRLCFHCLPGACAPPELVSAEKSHLWLIVARTSGFLSSLHPQLLFCCYVPGGLSCTQSRKVTFNLSSPFSYCSPSHSLYSAFDNLLLIILQEGTVQAHIKDLHRGLLRT